MTEPVKQESDEKVHAIKWRGEEWDRIELAARALTEREHFTVTPTDIIRSGAARRSEEILQHLTDAAA
jgi:hypothetical protein